MINHLSDVINKRKSTRSYSPEGMNDIDRQAIIEFINAVDLPFDHTVETKLFRSEYNKKLYTMFNAPLDNIAFISETDYLSISKAGFVGELSVLKASEMGYSSCWFGHYHLKTLNELLPHLDNETNIPKWSYGKGPVTGRRVICISPIGKWHKRGLRLIDRLQNNIISFKRKPIQDLLINFKEEDLCDDLRYALDLARKAPSAGNAQFWRFEIMQGQRSLKLSMPIGYKHLKWEHPNVDIGIAACHLWLALKDKGYEAEISVREEDKRAVWYFKW